MVRLEGVRKSFGDNLVLDGVNLSVDPGEVLVIIGPYASCSRTSAWRREPTSTHNSSQEASSSGSLSRRR